MKPEADMQTLRRCVAAQERHAPERWPSISLGAAALDDALPGRGLATGALHEFLPAAPGDLAALAGFGMGVLAQMLRVRTGFALLALPGYHMRREGAFYPIGLAALGCDPERLVHVIAPKSRSVLWALEEGLENPALAAVAGILPDDDRAYDFTASRRLAMRAAKTGVTALLMRAERDSGIATAAQTRWSVAAAPSAARHWAGGRAPGLGPPQWRVRLTKSKSGTFREWRVAWNEETLSFRLAAALADRTPVRAHRDAGKEWAAAS